MSDNQVNRQSSDLDELDFDLEPSGTIADLVAEMAGRDDTYSRFLRSRFIEQSISTLRRIRYDAGLTQADVADSMGTKQPAIARLERSDDITLGKIWDYLEACGRSPLPIQTVEIVSLRDFVAHNPNRPMTLSAVMGFRITNDIENRLWNTQGFKARDHISAGMIQVLLTASLNSILGEADDRDVDPLAHPSARLNVARQEMSTRDQEERVAPTSQEHPTLATVLAKTKDRQREMVA